MLCKRFPFRRYPHKLLAQIFFWYIQSLYQYNTGLELHRGLVILRNVCHAWRAVAMQHPVLSSYIPITDPTFVQDLLVKAGSMPLHICEELNPTIAIDFGIQVRQFVLRHIDRVRSMQLAVTDELVDPQRSLDNLRTGKSPLRTAVLCYILPSEHADPAPLLPNVDFPELVELACYYGTFSCFRKLLRSPSLRRLNIHSPHRGQFGAPPHEELMTVLRNLPLLEELLLHNVSDSGDWGQPVLGTTSRPPILANLPNLRLLTLHDHSLEALLPILQRTSYPATTSVKLDGIMLFNWNSAQPQVQDDILAALFIALSRKTAHDVHHSSTTYHVRSASVLIAQGSRFSISTWPERRPSTELTHSKHYTRAPGSLHIAFNINLAAPHSLSRLIHHARLSCIESLLISEPTIDAFRARTSQETLPIHALGALSSVTELMLEHESFDHLRDTSSVNPAIVDYLRGTSSVNPDIVSNEPIDIHGLFRGVSLVQIREFHHAVASGLISDHSRVKHLADAFIARAAGAGTARDGEQVFNRRPQVTRERTEYCELPAGTQWGGIAGHAGGGSPTLGGLPGINFLDNKASFTEALRASRG